MTDTVLTIESMLHAIPLASAQDSVCNTMEDSLHNALLVQPSNMDTALQQLPSFFTQHTSPYIPVDKVIINTDVFFLISLLLLICLAILRSVISKESNWSFFAKQTSSLSPNKTLFSSLRLIPSSLVIILGYTLLLTYTVNVKYSGYGMAKLMLFSFLAVLVYLLCYYLVMYVSGYFFSWKNQSIMYLKNTTIFRFLSGVCLFPLAFIANYMNINKIWMVLLMVFLLCFLLYKGFLYWSIFRKNMRWYEIFLYFCTIEILPAAVFIKFCNEQLHSNLTT